MKTFGLGILVLWVIVFSLAFIALRTDTISQTCPERLWIKQHVVIAFKPELFKTFEGSVIEIEGTPEELIRKTMFHTATGLAMHRFPYPEDEIKFQEFRRYLLNVRY